MLRTAGRRVLGKVILGVQKRQFDAGDWTHVGCVFPTEYLDFPNKKSGELYIWESVVSGELRLGFEVYFPRVCVLGLWFAVVVLG